MKNERRCIECNSIITVKGYSNFCGRDCYGKNYEKKNKEKCRLWRRQYYIEHREKIKAASVKWKKANIDKFNAYQKERRKKKKEEINKLKEENSKLKEEVKINKILKENGDSNKSFTESVATAISEQTV